MREQYWVICWWADKAGAAGVSKFATYPSHPTSGSHFQRHLDTAAGIDLKLERQSRYQCPVPMRAKYDLGRTKHNLVVNLPHEEADKEIIEHPDILERVRTSEWPAAYWKHQLVRDNCSSSGCCSVVPFALYLDGVPTTKRDGTLGFWVYNLITLKRILVCVLRTSSFCKCGCRGWCTIHPNPGTVEVVVRSYVQGRIPFKPPRQRSLVGLRFSAVRHGGFSSILQRDVAADPRRLERIRGQFGFPSMEQSSLPLHILQIT